MSLTKITVVLSQAPGKHPAKRSLEEGIIANLLVEPAVDASIIPNLYDLHPDHTGRLFLESIRGDMIVLSWLYPRAAFWLLDRCGIRGKQGTTLMQTLDEDSETIPNSNEAAKSDDLEENGNRVQAPLSLPDRFIYCLDLRNSNKPSAYLEEIRRVIAECHQRNETKRQKTVSLVPPLIQLGNLNPNPNRDLSERAIPPSENGLLHNMLDPSTNHHSRELQPPLDPTGNDLLGKTNNSNPFLNSFTPENLLAPTNRRWYPVIDYSRCTNCMECLDFCLFGVYGLDDNKTIFVDQQDQCKKGCPACSRVCPEQAIIFPEYKSPAIAGANLGSDGANGEINSLKIDLTKLFGGDSKNALTQAVAERDRELIADGRAAVGLTVGIPKRQENKSVEPPDELDRLMDDLDALGL